MEFSEKMEKHWEAKNPTPERKKRKTLENIKENEKESKLFIKYLEEEQDEDLLKELLTEETGNEEFTARLSQKKEEFLLLMEQSKEAEDLLDIKSIEKMADYSPEISQMASLVGFDRIREAVTHRLPEIAITDRDRFNALYENITAAAAKEDIQELNQRIAELSKRYNVGKEELEAAIMSDDEEKLEAIMEKAIGGFWTRNKTIKNKAASLKRATINGLKDLIIERDNAIVEIAQPLQALIMGNKIVNKALFARLKGKQPEKAEDEPSWKESEKGIPLPEQEVTQKDWEKWQAEHFLDGVDREESKREFVEQYARNHASKWSKGKKMNPIGRFMQDLFFSQALADMFNLS